MKNFNNIFDQIETTLKPEIVLAAENGTGYFNAMTTLKFEGDMARFTDRHGRKGIVCKTQLGNVVFFQRYLEKGIFAYNAHDNLRIVFAAVARGNVFSDDTLADWIGDFKPDNVIASVVDSILAAKLEQNEDDNWLSDF